MKLRSKPTHRENRRSCRWTPSIRAILSSRGFMRTDPTIERLAALLQVRARGMMLIRDELSGLFANMGRYSRRFESAVLART